MHVYCIIARVYRANRPSTNLIKCDDDDDNDDDGNSGQQSRERISHVKSPVNVGSSSIGGGNGVSSNGINGGGGGGGGANIFKKTTNEEGNSSTPPATKPRQRMRTSSMPVENRKVSLFVL